MKIIFFLSLLIISVSCYEWKECATGDFDVTSRSIKPEQFSRNDHVNIGITGNLKKVVTSGEIKIIIKYLNLPFKKYEKSICEFGESCPLQKGEHTFEYAFDIPYDAPNGEYKVKIFASDQGKNLLTCQEIDFEIESVFQCNHLLIICIII